MEHLDHDQIVLLALGEHTEQSAPGAGTGHSVGGSAATQHEHLRTCAFCRHELTQLTRTVELSREAGELGLQATVILHPSIWNRIADELGIGAAVDAPAALPVDDGIVSERMTPAVAVDDGSAMDDEPVQLSDKSRLSRPVGPSSAGSRAGGSRRPAGPHPAGSRRVGWRRGLIAAAAVVVIGAGVVGGIAIGSRNSSGAGQVQSQAVLGPVPAGPSAATGTATITQTSIGLVMNVTALELPLRQGYYEVWLDNPQANKMVPIGMLGPAGKGVWTLASTIDLRSFSIVNISAQDLDGNPAHKDSVLQGPLTE